MHPTLPRIDALLGDLDTTVRVLGMEFGADATGWTAADMADLTAANELLTRVLTRLDATGTVAA